MTKQVLDRASGSSVEEAEFASPIEHDLLSTEVYVRLRRQIVRGRLAPGQRIGEADFARRWRVSQATVREALRRLASDGLVIQIPRRGSYVASVSEATARLAYDVRFTVEPIAVTQVSRAAMAPCLPPSEYELDRMRAAAAADDTAMLVDADVTFHRRVWEQSEGDLLPGSGPKSRPRFGVLP
ncbi:MAG: GntR family transcriptional regulator [Acidimicrobiia bacterium]|nr:GntR family transcriptional regulator [Acidimicrobiia bacterium]